MATKRELKKQFELLYELNKKTPVLTKNKNGFRISTLNVHYWTNLHDKSSVDTLLEDIGKINADIMCLQEVSFGKTKYNKYNYQELLNLFKNLGYIDSIEVRCSPWVGADYGNIILSKYPLTKKANGLLYKGTTKVKRGYCFAYVEKMDINICCVHLDVFDESGKTRDKQLNQLLKLINAPDIKLIICGDFNCIREKDYTEEQFKIIKERDQLRNSTTDIMTLQVFEKTGYISCFDAKKMLVPHGTVWSNLVVDFIFVHNNASFVVDICDIYRTINSDHFGIYMDILCK